MSQIFCRSCFKELTRGRGVVCPTCVLTGADPYALPLSRRASPSPVSVYLVQRLNRLTSAPLRVVIFRSRSLATVWQWIQRRRHRLGIGRIWIERDSAPALHVRRLWGTAVEA